MDQKSVVELTKGFLNQLIPLSQQYDINHLLTPDNILISEDVVELQITDQEEPLQKSIGIFPGYSAPENYQGSAGSQASVYFVGALMYTLLTGAPPPDAPSRSKNLLLNNEEPLENVINRSLDLNKDKRIYNLVELLEELNKVEKQLKILDQNIDGEENKNKFKQEKELENKKEAITEKKHSTIIKRFIIVIIILSILGIASYFGYGIYQSNQLEKAYNNEDYAATVAILNNNKKLKEKEQKIYTYAQAKLLMEADKTEEALPLFETLGDYKDSQDIINTEKYNLAKSKMDAGELEASVPLFKELGEYSDSAEMATKIEQYIAARSNPDLIGQFQGYKSIGDFLDSAAHVEELAATVYATGVELYVNRNFEAAITYFENVPEREQAAVYLEASQIWMNASDIAVENLASLPRLIELSGTADVGPVVMSNRFFMAYLRGSWNSPDGGGTLTLTETDFGFSNFYFGGGNHLFSNGQILSGDKVLASFEYFSYNEVRVTFPETGAVHIFQRV